MSRFTPRRWFALGLAALIVPLTACGTAGTPAGPGTGGGGGSAPRNADGEYIFVVKLSGGDWFGRMDKLSQEYGKEKGLTVKQLAGDDASEEKQISIISDVIPQKPAALLVVPTRRNPSRTFSSAPVTPASPSSRTRPPASPTPTPPSRRSRTRPTARTRWSC